MQTLQEQVEESEKRHSAVKGQVSFVRTCFFDWCGSEVFFLHILLGTI